MNKIEKRSERKNDIAKLTFEGSIQTPVAYVFSREVTHRKKFVKTQSTMVKYK